jgi:NADPH-dependent glutamate synthase beta subunit-like oxidoreductase/ferredoxin
MDTHRLASLADHATQLLAQGRHNEAIDLIRAHESPHDPRLCALLAQGYLQRGDSKGDVYASHYFACRALELGSIDPTVSAIRALAAFRQGQFAEAVWALERYVNEHSAPTIKLFYGLLLQQCGRHEEAGKWVDPVLDEQPNVDSLRALLQSGRQSHGSPTEGKDFVPAASNMFATVIERLRATRALDIDAPFEHNALSKLRGYGSAAKDFHWLEKNIPCQAACPAGTDIPGYLGAIYRGDYQQAYRINLWDNVFPAVLGRVCSRPCESACRHGWEELGEPVAICWSKRSSADFTPDGLVVLDKVYPPTGKRVAVIGSGVAGLTAARNLALLGHAVTVFEKHHAPGGMMIQGIPEFRLPRDIITREIEQVRATGVEIRCQTEIGKDLPLAALTEGFDAVILAAGTLRPNLLHLPGSELFGIRHGLDFLLEVNETRNATDFGRRVVVIGGGFTAMDCARSAWRLGAEVRVAYRRGQKEMLITPGELEALEAEGIPMDFFVNPVAYLGDAQGRVKAMRFVRTELGDPDPSGRRRPMAISGTEFDVPCDTVLLATGQFPDTGWIQGNDRPLLDEQGVMHGRTSGASAHQNIFIAGDFATGATTLIDAIAHAKQCALDVDRTLMGEQRVLEVAEVVDAPGGSGRIREMDAVPMQEMPVIPVHMRGLNAEVETGYSRGLSVEETQRCYMCHLKYEIDPDKCIYCDWCLKVKPRPNCIVRVKALTYDAQGRITGYQQASSTEETTMIYINQEDCIRCNACVEACPVDCISVQRVSRRTVTNSGKALCAMDTEAPPLAPSLIAMLDWAR